jgi:hypothetical protein
LGFEELFLEQQADVEIFPVVQETHGSVAVLDDGQGAEPIVGLPVDLDLLQPRAAVRRIDSGRAASGEPQNKEQPLTSKKSLAALSYFLPSKSCQIPPSIRSKGESTYIGFLFNGKTSIRIR